MIAYKFMSFARMAVLVEGRVVGHIKKVDSGWVYKPKSGHAGEVFPSVAALKQSLEDPLRLNMREVLVAIDAFFKEGETLHAAAQLFADDHDIKWHVNKALEGNK